MTTPPRPPYPPDDRPVTLDRREGPYGEVVLRRRGEVFEIIANGCFLMDSSDGRSERVLVRAALDALPPATAAASSGSPAGVPTGADGPRTAPRSAPALLIGGLGVGFSLTEATGEPRWGSITVVERESAVIDWHRAGPLRELSSDALADPRTEVRHADLLAHLRGADRRYDALCLDIDNGPDWTVTEDNAGVYSPAGLAACRDRLTVGGVLAVWSARPSTRFEEALRDAGFSSVRTREIPVARGVPDVVHIALRGA